MARFPRFSVHVLLICLLAAAVCAVPAEAAKKKKKRSRSKDSYPTVLENKSQAADGRTKVRRFAPPPADMAKGGPYPWTRASGPVKGRNTYRFYPSQNTYFDPATGTYSYVEDGGWRQSKYPPERLKNAPNAASMDVSTDSNKPYLYNRSHRAQAAKVLPGSVSQSREKNPDLPSQGSKKKGRKKKR